MTRRMVGGLSVAAVIVATLVAPKQSVAAAGQDEAFALRHLLGIRMEPYWIVAPSGQRLYDALAEYQAWSDVYDRVRVQAQGDSDEGLRLYLFMGFAAQARNDAALSESLSSDLYPIFTRRRADVFRVLGELPFLVRSTCHYVAAYHGFEDRNVAGRETAMADAIKAATAALSQDSATVCVQELRR